MQDNSSSFQEKPSKTLYRDLADRFRGYIQEGYWKVGHIIPTESELCEQFSVSRSTLRKTMEYLTQKGYLERRAGKGTWAVDYYLSEELWVVDGISPTYPFPDRIRLEIFSHDALVNDHTDPILSAFPSEPVLSRVKAIRWLDRTPLNLAYVYMKPEDAEKVIVALDPQKDIYFFKVLERVSGKIVVKVKDSYEAIPAVGEISERLQVPAGTPLMLAKRLALDEEDELLVGVRLHMRTDIQKLTMSRTRTLAPKKFRH